MPRRSIRQRRRSIFFLVTRISEAPVAMKAAMVALEGVAVWAILQLLAARGLPRSRRPALRMASAAALGVRPQRAYRYRGDCLAPAGLPGDGPALADPGRHRARCRRPGQVFSGRHRSCTLQALGLAFSDCVHRDRRRSISALCRRGEQGVRFPRPLSHRGGHRPGFRCFLLAASRRGLPAQRHRPLYSTWPPP